MAFFNKTDTNYFKTKLEEEKEQLEKALSKIAERNPQNPEDWETKSEELNIMPSDQSEMADVLEEYGNTAALETEMEQQLNKVKAALKRIKDGKYGICKVKNCKIEEGRLKADPTAETCMEHTKHN